MRWDDSSILNLFMVFFLMVKVLYYRLRVCFVLNKCNINESNEVILQFFSGVLLVFSNIQANPELRESLESLWNVDKPHAYPFPVDGKDVWKVLRQKF